MLNSLFEFSLRNRFLVLVFVGLIIAAGVYAMRKLPIDAVPDVTPNQVQILTDSPGLGPVEVEKFITFPVETALSGLPGITGVPFWAVRRHRVLRGRDGHLFLPATCHGTTAAGAAGNSTGIRQSRDGPDFDGIGGGLPVRGQGPRLFPHAATYDS